MTPTKPQIQGALIGLAVTLTGATIAHKHIQPAKAAPVVNKAPTSKAPILDVDRLCKAIGHIESGGRNLPPRWDVNGISTGVYQFHLPRWLEIGGTRANFGKASVKEQTRLLRRAIVKRKFTTFERVASWHNGRGPTHHQYAVKLAKAYRSK